MFGKCHFLGRRYFLGPPNTDLLCPPLCHHLPIVVPQRGGGPSRGPPRKIAKAHVGCCYCYCTPCVACPLSSSGHRGGVGGLGIDMVEASLLCTLLETQHSQTGKSHSAIFNLQQNIISNDEETKTTPSTVGIYTTLPLKTECICASYVILLPATYCAPQLCRPLYHRMHDAISTRIPRVSVPLHLVPN